MNQIFLSNSMTQTLVVGRKLAFNSSTVTLSHMDTVLTQTSHLTAAIPPARSPDRGAVDTTRNTAFLFVVTNKNNKLNNIGAGLNPPMTVMDCPGVGPDVALGCQRRRL